MNLFHLDPVLLSRIQFAFVVSFHIVFPAFTIGLASWLAVVEWRWLRTGKAAYRQIYRLWSKIFAVAFGMGVVSGVVMSYQFGTNWSVFATRTGNVLGPLLGYEVLTAFFLEASFLGIMLFGWNKVGPRMHFIATLAVAGGTLLSAFWILAANSWMQTPDGFRIGEDGKFYPVDWLRVIFNPSFPFRFAHMVTAAYLTTAFTVGGIGAWYLWCRRHVAEARIMLGMAMLMAVFVAPAQIAIGDAHGLNTLHHQPAKVSAMEGIWETERGAGLRLFGIPNEKRETTDYAVEIPHGASLILTHSMNGEVKGLKEWPKADRPPVLIVFFAFRIMVGLGFLMAFTGLAAAILFLRRRLFESRPFQFWCMMMTPAGFIALLSGWFVTEVGRQPWSVYGALRTAQSASPVPGAHVALSLLAFIAVYTFVFGAGSYYILRLIGKGPGTQAEGFHAHDTVAAPFAAPQQETGEV